MIAARSALLLVVACALTACSGISIGSDNPIGGTPSSSVPTSTTAVDMPGMDMPGMDMPGMDMPGMDMPNGSGGDMEVLPSKIPDSPAARARAATFRRRVIAAVQTHLWHSVAELHAAGFQPMAMDKSHWYNKANLTDRRLFDPDRPEFLVVLGGEVFGEMFLAPSMSLTAPEPPGAPLMRWHYHAYMPDTVCTTPWLTQYVANGSPCRAGDHFESRSPLMTHVWISGSSDPFSAMMLPPDAH